MTDIPAIGPKGLKHCGNHLLVLQVTIIILCVNEPQFLSFPVCSTGEEI